MKKAMGWKDADPYQYYYDRGLYYHEIIPDLLCGSQPRNTEDIEELQKDVGATTIINVSAHELIMSVCIARPLYGRLVISADACSCSRTLIFTTGEWTLERYRAKPKSST